MKTQYYTATSLDGFIATEDDSLEWLFPLGDVNDTGYPAFIAHVGALAMGANTYDWIHAELPVRPGSCCLFAKSGQAATLDAATLAADKGAFFGSILGTLNHVAVAADHVRCNS